MPAIWPGRGSEQRGLKGVEHVAQSPGAKLPLAARRHGRVGRLTVFIGPNAAGKSAFFKALMALAKLLRNPLRGPQQAEFEIERGITLDRAVWKGDDSLPIGFQVWFEDDGDEEPGYTLELRKVAAGWSVTRERMRLGDEWFDSAERPFEHPTEFRGIITWRPPYRGTLSSLSYRYRRDPEAALSIAPLTELADRIGLVWRYRVAVQDIASLVSPRAQLEVGVELRPFASPRFRRELEKIYVGSTGWGLAWVLRKLQGEERDKFIAVERELHDLFPHIKSINFEEVGASVGLAFTSDRSARLLPAALESNGVLHSLLLLWRLHTAEPGMTLCFEEPETGTHPYLLKGRYDLLKRFAQQAKHVLIATHSPDFLAAIEDRQEALDVVRVVEWGSEVGTQVHRLRDLKHVELLLDTFKGNVGELWWSGAIGGG